MGRAVAADYRTAPHPPFCAVREVASEVARDRPGVDTDPAVTDELNVAAQRLDRVVRPARQLAVDPDVAAGRPDPQLVDATVADRHVARYGANGQRRRAVEIDRHVARHHGQVARTAVAAKPRIRRRGLDPLLAVEALGLDPAAGRVQLERHFGRDLDVEL